MTGIEREHPANRQDRSRGVGGPRNDGHIHLRSRVDDRVRHLANGVIDAGGHTGHPQLPARPGAGALPRQLCHPHVNDLPVPLDAQSGLRLLKVHRTQAAFHPHPRTVDVAIEKVRRFHRYRSRQGLPAHHLHRVRFDDRRIPPHVEVAANQHLIPGLQRIPRQVAHKNRQ